MEAIVLAGGIPRPGDPLYPHTKGGYKAMMSIASKPMIQWVLTALGGSKHITRVFVVGLIDPGDLHCPKPNKFLPGENGLLGNVKIGLHHIQTHHPESNRILIVSSDIPTITPSIIDWRVETAMDYDCDFDYALVERKVMEMRFPGAERTYVRLKELEVCGGDLTVVRVGILRQETLWERLIAARKSVFRQMSILGVPLLLKFLTRRLSLAEAEQKAGERFGLKGRGQLCPYAELAMDIDTPTQFELVQTDLLS